MFIRSQLQQRGPQQRALSQVERLAGFAGDFFTGSLQALIRIKGGQVDMADLHLRTVTDTLQHLPVNFLEGGTQALVALHQVGKGQVKRLMIKPAEQAHGPWQVVGSAARLQLPEEPHALLGIGELVAAGDAAAVGDGVAGEIDLLVAQGGEEDTAFFQRQFNEAARQLQGLIEGAHRSSEPVMGAALGSAIPVERMITARI